MWVGGVFVCGVSSICNCLDDCLKAALLYLSATLPEAFAVYWAVQEINKMC